MIQEYEIENLKAITNCKGSLINGVYFVTGDNDLGKSTFLHIIDALFTGKLNKHELLQQGKKNGFVKLETEKHTINCEFSRSNPHGSITLTDKNSGFTSTKKTILQEIFGYNSFDAEEFVRWSESVDGRRKQVKIIKDLYPVDVITRLNTINTLVETAKFNRKPVNTEIDRLTSLIDDITFTPNLKITEAVKVKELIEEKDKIVLENSNIKKAKEAKLIFKENKIKSEEAIKKENVGCDDKIKKLEEDLKKQIKLTKQARDKAIDLHHKEVLNYMTRIDDASKYLKGKIILPVDDLNDKILNAETLNTQLKKNTKLNQLKESKKLEAAKKAKFETELISLDEEKTTLIKENNPVDGLSFDEEKLVFNGIPFDNANISDSEKLMVAFKIQTMKNPNAKIFLIARGESIGSKKMNTILNFAKEKGYQGFIEKMIFGQEELKIEKYDINS